MSSEQYLGPGGNSSLTSLPTPYNGNGPFGLRDSSMDSTTYILILLVVLIPIIFTVVLCTITYCIYRYNKNRIDSAPTNSRIVSVDRSGAPIATVIYNTQHSPFIFEESPPSYDSLADIKKDPHNTATNTNEHVQLTTILPNTRLTNTNEGVAAAAAAVPTAPTPPPSYINLAESNK